MAEKIHGEGIDRLEQVIHILAEDQVSLQKLIAELAKETRIGFDRVQKQFEEADKRMTRTDERIDRLFLEADKRMTKTDEHIDKLVSAIGEFIRKSS